MPENRSNECLKFLQETASDIDKTSLKYIFWLLLTVLAICPYVSFADRSRQSGSRQPAPGIKYNTLPGRLKKTRQLILVLSPDLTSTHARLYFFEKSKQGVWHEQLTALPVMLGARGMAWAEDLSGQFNQELPRKKEGDLKSPAGLFAINEAFAYDHVPTHIRQLQLKTTTLCIDDTASAHYNQLIDTIGISKDWKSAEHMRQVTQYRYGLVIEQNTVSTDSNSGTTGSSMQPVQKGAGSCIFVHIVSAAGKTTAGCTAMREQDLTSLLERLDQEKLPVIVQLPLAQYKKYQKLLKLPSI